MIGWRTERSRRFAVHRSRKYESFGLGPGCVSCRDWKGWRNGLWAIDLKRLEDSDLCQKTREEWTKSWWYQKGGGGPDRSINMNSMQESRVPSSPYDRCNANVKHSMSSKYYTAPTAAISAVDFLELRAYAIAQGTLECAEIKQVYFLTWVKSINARSAGCTAFYRM